MINYVSKCGLFWSRIYRRQFLLENHLFFPELSFYEDSYFNFLSALLANRVEKVEQSFYHYVQRKNSTVSSRNSVRQYERINMAQLIFDDCKRRGLSEKFKEVIEYKYILMMASNVLFTCLGKFDVPDKEKIANIGNMVKRNCPKFKKNIYYKRISLDQRCYLNLAISNPNLAIWCYNHNVGKYLGIFQAILRKLGVS